MDIVSACLIGEKCRYDGGACTNEELKKLLKQGKLKAVCPEVMAGLKTPRSPLEIVGGDGKDVLEGKAKVMSKDGKDVTEQFIRGAEMALKEAKLCGAKKAYLQSRSPSCGCGKIYDGSFRGVFKTGDGVAAALLKKNGIKIIEV